MFSVVLVQQLLRLAFMGACAATTVRSLSQSKRLRLHYLGFVGIRQYRTVPLWQPPQVSLLHDFGKCDTYSGRTASVGSAPGAHLSCGKLSSLTFVDWGRGPTAPASSERLLQQQGRKGNISLTSGLLFCTTWDPRSKALISALRLLEEEARRAHTAPHLCENGLLQLPVYPLIGVRITNSLVIARSRRALTKQRRMACNMKQLRHNERALRFMLQQQPPLQLKGLPALQLYTQKQQIQEQGGASACSVPMQKLLEIRSMGPRTLQRLGEDEGALLGAWGPEAPPSNPSAAAALGAWLRRLGQLYEEELKTVVQKRLQQADDEYPIYASYSP
ncbi:hypothetical protein, conserved [Eimeria necatrix]|uniref:Uncharacterized protein n=1 Tax=Eimeria necatrix TaxID=51315 RepID=U6MNQ3_9EIME|nr:hypothetical protein, conserved [Eimeria necatrix]CDJ64074.1 hypothetical protein, conserved [Eimeria necatrix]